MNVLDIIEAKKRGRELGEAEINDLIAGFTAQEVPEYQMAARSAQIDRPKLAFSTFVPR